MDALTDGLTGVFRNVLLSSLISAFIMASIVAVRQVIGRRMSAKSQARLWIILVFFLVFPVPRLLGMISIPDDSHMKAWIPVQAVVQRFTIEPAKSVVVVGGDEQEASPGTPSIDPVPSTSGASVVRDLDTSQILWLAGSLIWLAGALFFLSMLVAGYRSALHALRKSYRTADPVWVRQLEQTAARIGCRSPVELLVCDRAESPYIIGIFRYRIVMPSDIFNRLTSEQVDAILTHELVHLRHFDPQLRLLLCILRAIRWYDPLLRIAIRLIVKDHEYYCDEATVNECTIRDARPHYAETLLAAAQAYPGSRFVVPPLQASPFMESGFKDRVGRVLQKRRTSLTLTSIAVLVVVVSGCAMLPGFFRTSSSGEIQPTPTINPSPAPTSTTGSSLPVETPTPLQDDPMFQNLPGDGILTELDFGDMKAHTYEFYWSPYAPICMFKGYKRGESDNEYLTGVYFWNTKTNRVSQLVEDIPDKDAFTYLGSPSWSPDGTKATIPLFISGKATDFLKVYDIVGDTVEKLPIRCDVAHFSADSSRLVYTDDNGHLKVYDLASRSVVGPASEVDGSGLLFSDNRRLVNIVRTVNPLGIEYTWHCKIEMFDIGNPSVVEVIAPDVPGGSIEWLVQDKLLLLSVTGDEVRPYILIDVESHRVTKLGYPGISLFDGWGHDMRLVADYDAFQNKADLSDNPDLQRLIVFTTSNRPEYESIDSISILPDGTILCIGLRYDQTMGRYLYRADRSGEVVGKVVLLPGDLVSPVSTRDGKFVVLTDQATEKTYLLDVEKLYSYMLRFD